MKSALKSIVLAGALTLAVSSVSADVLYSDNFSTIHGWTLGNNWQIGATKASSGGFGYSDPALDHTATADNGVLGALLGGNVGAPEGMHDFYYATSPVYNLSGAKDVNLSYSRWLNTDYDPFMTSQLEAFDGSNWQVIYTNCCSGERGYVADNDWMAQSFDVSAYADGNAQFQLRFSYDVTSGGVFTIGGWNVDDLVISGKVPEPASLALFGLGLAGLCLGRRKKA